MSKLTLRANRRPLVPIQATVLLALFASLSYGQDSGQIVSTTEGGDRIYGGRSYPAHKYPFLVSVLDGDQHICSGVIIDQTHILTTQGCDERAGRKIKLRVGDHDLLQSEDGQRAVQIKSSVRHPKADLIVYTTKKKLWNSGSKDKVNKIGQPSKDWSAKPGTKVTVIGWGFTGASRRNNLPREVEIKIVKCPKKLEGEPAQVCASNPDGKGGCIADQGGPIFTKNGSGDFELVGIIDLISAKCNGNAFITSGINLHHIRDWIQEHSKAEVSDD